MRTMYLLYLALAPILVATATQANAQQCTVPNTLTNGQVADATEVMDNFNALVTCVENVESEAVTHEGTPNAGEIAVFDSATGITGGNLTGDVTTSGGTQTTLADTGVTPGTYVSPNISVDAKGRITSVAAGAGGGGSGITSARVFMSGQQSLAANTWATIQFDTVDFSTLTGIWSGGPAYEFIVPSGVNRAEITASTGTTATDHNGGMYGTIQRNGSSVAVMGAGNDYFGRLIISSGVISVSAGDRIRMRVVSGLAKTFGDAWLQPSMSIKLWNE